MIISHSFRRGHRTRIPLDAESVQSAVINGRDIANKYNVDAKAFMLDYADTEELESGTLVVLHDRNKNIEIHMETS